jgi:hypothetical protein
MHVGVDDLGFFYETLIQVDLVLLCFASKAKLFRYDRFAAFRFSGSRSLMRIDFLLKLWGCFLSAKPFHEYQAIDFSSVFG